MTCYTGMRFGKGSESMTMRFIRSEGRSETEERMILGENVARLFRAAE
ncbi:MAG: hypothetical protein IKR48_06865 [Kiritimatiellae bacterium]|nr:hypothetical protein [Kiritimatiellia bacterium]